MIQIGVIGVNQVLGNLKKMDKTIRDRVDHAIDESAAQVLADSRRTVAKAWGNLARSGQTPKIQGGRQVLFNANYAMQVEFGRKPGKRPPLQAIIDWVHKKGLVGTYRKTGMQSRRRIGNSAQMLAEDKPVAFMIAKKIGKYGTKPQPFLFPAFEKERPRFVAKLKAITQKP